MRLPDTKLYTFIGYQEWPGHEPLALYDLLEDVPGHPKGSTISNDTIISLGLNATLIREGLNQ